MHIIPWCKSRTRCLDSSRVNPEDVVLSMAAHARFVLDNIVVLFRVRGWDDIITFARTLLKAEHPKPGYFKHCSGTWDMLGV